MLHIENKKFNQLTAIRFHHTDKKRQYWEFRCDCGKTVILDKIKVVYGKIKNCHDKKRTTRDIKIKEEDKKRLITIRNGMINRCYRPYTSGYKYYGERGIKVCEEWKKEKEGIVNFIDWAIKNGYKKTKSIDRKNPNKDYCPENCRWATDFQQANNRRNNIKIKYKGKYTTIKSIAKRIGCSNVAIWKKIKQNKPIELTQKGIIYKESIKKSLKNS